MSQVRKWRCSEVKLHTCSPRIGQQYNWDERGRLVSELDHCALGVNPGLGPVLRGHNGRSGGRWEGARGHGHSRDIFQY